MSHAKILTQQLTTLSHGNVGRFKLIFCSFKHMFYRVLITIGCSWSKLIPRIDHRLAEQLMVIHPGWHLLLQFLIQELLYPHICRVQLGRRNSIR